MIEHFGGWREVPKRGNSWIFSILLNFAMTQEAMKEWLFFLYKHVMPIFLLLLMYFITRIKWDVIISSLLGLLMKVWIWHRCQNRKSLSSWRRTIIFLKKGHIKTQNKKKDVLLILILLLYNNPLYYRKNEESNLFDKTCTQEKP